MLNCKIRCNKEGKDFKLGEAFEVIDGRIQFSEDNCSAGTYESIEEINRIFISQFEFYEEQPSPIKDSGTTAELVTDIHNNAIAHGWYDEQRSFGGLIALCHTELSEAFEEYRKGYKTDEVYGKGYPEAKMSVAKFEETYTDRVKPEGVLFELADVVIRIFDMCGYYGIDIEKAIQIKHKFNKTRPYKHGGKTV